MNTTEQEENKLSRKENYKPTIIKLMFKPKILIAVILIYAGLGIPFLLKTQQDLASLIVKIGPTTLGIISALIGLAMGVSEVSRLKEFKREARFIDVDDNRVSEENIFQKRITSEINTIKAKSDSFSTGNLEEIVSKVIESKVIDQANMFDSFENYFNEIRRVLLEQAYTSDKKASILLDKGTAYSKGGITFFIVSIIIWQLLSWLTEFKEQYIYGMISCSLLFVFIEFLSAWFLKQYRHFVDTSTYHIKVKSIFDKYMMSYLAIKTLGGNNNDETKYLAMLKVLEEEIKWPESYLLKKSDVSFAKEAIETMSHFAKAMKSEVKNREK